MAESLSSNPADPVLPPEPSPAAEPAPSAPDAVRTEPGTPEVPEALIDLALKDLQSRRQTLEQEIVALEKRRDQIDQDIRSSFSGQSEAVARRLKGFQDYLVGALQELVVTAEQMDLVVPPLLSNMPQPLSIQVCLAWDETITMT
jgi:hypothetical protein